MPVPALPVKLTRWSVDAHYTALVEEMREGGSPAAVAEAAYEQMIQQFEARHPGAEIPEYMARLGREEDEGLDDIGAGEEPEAANESPAEE